MQRQGQEEKNQKASDDYNIWNQGNAEAVETISYNAPIELSNSRTYKFFCCPERYDSEDKDGKVLFQLPCFLDSDNKNFLSLGIGVAYYENMLIKHFPESKIVGYEYTQSAVEYHRKIASPFTIRQIDLNTINKDGQLDYQKQLELDLENPTHLFAINILQYLDEAAVILLMHALMDKAKPGTIFYIYSHVFDPTALYIDYVPAIQKGTKPSVFTISLEDEKKLITSFKKNKSALKTGNVRTLFAEEIKHKKNMGCLTQNYIPSFFARTDIETLKHVKVLNIFGPGIAESNETYIVKKV